MRLGFKGCLFDGVRKQKKKSSKTEKIALAVCILTLTIKMRNFL